MSARIFISYSRHDSEFARELESALNNRGFNVWLDTDRLRLGELWREEIVQAIEECNYFLLLLSPHSIHSVNVVRELSLAESSSRLILPVMVEQVEIPDTMKYQLAGLQFVVFNSSLGNQGFQSLLSALPSPHAERSLDRAPEPSRSSQRPTSAETGDCWDKRMLLQHLTLAIGPMASLLVEPLPDPLHASDVQTLRTLFQQQRIDLDLLDRSLTPSQLASNCVASDIGTQSLPREAAIKEWFRIQVGPIADMIFDVDLCHDLSQNPSRARARLEELGVAPSVIDQVLHRFASVESSHRSKSSNSFLDHG
jgi:hypothetical protein